MSGFSNADKGRPQISIIVIINVFDSLKNEISHWYIHLQLYEVVSLENSKNFHQRISKISQIGHLILYGRISVDHLIVVLVTLNKKIGIDENF